MRVSETGQEKNEASFEGKRGPLADREMHDTCMWYVEYESPMIFRWDTGSDDYNQSKSDDVQVDFGIIPAIL